MRRVLPLLVFVLALPLAVRAGDAPPSTAAAKPDENVAIREWIHANAVALPPGGDLAPFGRLVGNAHIAVLGDASNGMHELFTVKNRLIEVLVAEKGFTSIAMAASFPDAMAINDYILHGTGDPSSVLAGLGFWTWNSDEVLELIEWLRAWNADPSHPHKVSFHGLDMQNSAAVAERLREALGSGSAAALDALAPLEKRFGYANEPEWVKKKVVAAIHTLESDVERRRKELPDVELARQEVRLLHQAEEVFRRPLGEGDPREPRMAVNAQWLLDHDAPGTKLVIWAFNGQAGVHAPSARPSLGSALRRKYGNDVVIIGSAFGRGSLHAVPEGGGALTTFTTPPVREGSLDALVSANAPPVSLLDLRTARGEARTWLTSMQTAHTIAEHYAVSNDAAYYARLRPLETFDGIVFIKDTTASHLRAPAVDNLASAEAARWMKANAVPLKTAEAGHGFDDLAPVGEMVGGARIVALGEATHGTREFFQLKHRMLEYLVAKKGFTVFGIEASFPDALAVNDYVLHGTGDPAVALAGLQFWTWNTDEVLDMIKWMRAWNADPAHTAKVEFLGFDMQNPDASVRKLREYFTANGIDGTEALKKRDVKMLTTLLDSHKANTSEWELAREEVRLLEQGIEVLDKQKQETDARDRYMAENVTWILDHHPAGTKMVLWAHNGHIHKGEAWDSPSWISMGRALQKTYGEALIVFGFAFDHGEFQAMKYGGGNLQKMTVKPAPEGSLDALLAANAPPIAALDLRTARGAARQWLNEEQRTRWVGAVFDPSHDNLYLARVQPLVCFDALLFVAETTAAHGRGTRASALQPPPDPKALNLAFDEGKPGEPPPGWKNNSLAAGYRALVTNDGCVSGTCVKVSRDAEQTREGFGVLMQRIDATPYRGKKIRFRARIRSDIPPGASARLWLRVDRPKGVMGMLDNMGNRLPGALPQWTELEAHGEVAADAEAIAFGLLFSGDGTAWMDDAVLEVVE